MGPAPQAESASTLCHDPQTICMHVQCFRSIAPEPGLANVFYKGPQSNYLRLCRLCGLRHVCSTLNPEGKAAVDSAGGGSVAHAPDKPLFRKQVEASLAPGQSCRRLALRPRDPGALSLGRQQFHMLNQAPRAGVGEVRSLPQPGSSPSTGLLSTLKGSSPQQGGLRGWAVGGGGPVVSLGGSQVPAAPEAGFSPGGRKEGRSPLKDTEVFCSIAARSLLSPSYYHSFGVTENYIVFLEQPFKLDILKMATAYIRGVSWASCLAFHGEDKVRPSRGPPPNSPRTARASRRSAGRGGQLSGGGSELPGSVPRGTSRPSRDF